MKNIGVIGATGHLGKHVTIALAAQTNFEVYALVRNKNKAQTILPKEVKLVEGDILDRRSIKNFLTQVDYLYINLSVLHNQKKTDLLTEREGLILLLEEAKLAGIKQVGYISSLVMRYNGMNNFSWWVFDVKQKAVEHIKNSGIPYLIFYPSNFMDNFHHVYRDGHKILLAGTSHHKMYFIAAQDFAKQVVQAFEKFDVQSKDFVIQGPEGFTADEAAALFVREYKKEKLTISKAPLGLLTFLGYFVQKINYGAHIVEALNNYPEKFEAEETWQALGKPEITLAQFARS
ncbi:MAG: SDR family oxidoreductase [Chryseotalea sp.]